jgi:hypothetical protein
MYLISIEPQHESVDGQSEKYSMEIYLIERNSFTSILVFDFWYWSFQVLIVGLICDRSIVGFDNDFDRCGKVFYKEKKKNMIFEFLQADLSSVSQQDH